MDDLTFIIYLNADGTAKIVEVPRRPGEKLAVIFLGDMAPRSRQSLEKAVDEFVKSFTGKE